MGAGVGAVVEKVGLFEFFDEIVDESEAFFEILINVVIAGFFDLAGHDIIEIAFGGAEALEVVEAGIMEVGWGDFSGGFWFAGLLFFEFGVVIHGGVLMFVVRF